MRGGRVNGGLILAEGLDGLAEQGDFADSARDVRLHLAHDLGDGAAAFAPASERDDAVGTELVAALNDRHVGGDRGGAFRVDRGPELAAEIGPRRQIEDADDVVEVLRLGEGVDVGEALAQGVVLGANHAAHDGDLEVGVVLFEGAQIGELGGRPVLGVLAHGASVDDDEVGVLGAVGGLPAEASQAGAEFGAVGDVHLTADGPEVVGLHRVGAPLGIGRWARWSAGWRRVRDSNPRSSLPETRLAGGRTRPLCEPSAADATSRSRPRRWGGLAGGGLRIRLDGAIWAALAGRRGATVGRCALPWGATCGAGGGARCGDDLDGPRRAGGT